MIRRLDITLAAALCAAAFLFAPDATAENGPITARSLVAPTLGQSVFSDTEYTHTAMRYELALGAAAQGFSGELSVGFTHFLSVRPPRTAEVVAGDLAGGASYALLVAGPLTISPRLDVVLPLSKYSRDLSLVFASHVGVDAEVAAGPIRIQGHARLRRDLYEAATPPPYDGNLADYRSPDPGPFGFRTAGSRLMGREDASLTAFRAPTGIVLGGFPNVAWGTHLGVDIEGAVAGGVYADLGLGWTHTWSYKIERPPNVIASRTQPNRLQLNINTGSLGVGWRGPAGPVELGVRLGISTTGPGRTVDDRRSRFPWWNFEDAATDESVLDLRLSARY